MIDISQFSTSGQFVLRRDYLVPARKKPVSEIIDEVLRKFPGITVEDLKGPRIARKYVTPRHLAIYEVHRQRPDLSYPQIGRIFGDRDHAACIHAVRRVEAARQAAE